MENKEPTAWFTLQCWGCNKAVTRPYSDHDDVQHKIELLKLGGWRRREFGPNASPWFCSEDCAINSYNAKQAEEWWAKHNWEEYCRNAIIPPALWAPLAFAGILILVALLGVWCNAGTQ
jgi:hypothetical protein